MPPGEGGGGGGSLLGAIVGGIARAAGADRQSDNRRRAEQRRRNEELRRSQEQTVSAGGYQAPAAFWYASPLPSLASSGDVATGTAAPAPSGAEDLGTRLGDLPIFFPPIREQTLPGQSWEAPVFPTLPGFPPLERIPRVPIYRATAQGSPPGTGSGATSGTLPDPGDTTLTLALVILDLLRRFGVRLPWDPRPPKWPSFSFTLPTFTLPSVNAYPEVGTMANIWSSVLSAGGQLLGGILQGAQGPGGGMFGQGPIYGGYGMGTPGMIVAPGGSPIMSGLQDVLAAAGGGAVASLGSPWSPGRVGARPKLFVVPNPTTGAPVWFRPAGRPVLFSGDFAAARRLRKIAGRARRRVGGR